MPVYVKPGTSKCAVTRQPLRIEIDHELHFRVLEGEAPRLFVPLVDFEKLADPSIIHAF